MDKMNLGLKSTVSVLAIVIVIGGFIYSNQKANTREETVKQALISSIDAQNIKEDQAKADNATAPVVSEDYPARIIPESVEAPKESSSATKEIPRQSLPPLKVAPKELEVPPPASQEAVQAITALSDADIQRLQSYKQFDGGGSYTSFQDMYLNQRANCDGLMAKFSAVTLSDYAQAKVEWLTSPKLVYRSIIGQFCVRGVLSLTYYNAENKFRLTPNVKYQREVEYRLRSSYGSTTLKLESTAYLSDFVPMN